MLREDTHSDALCVGLSLHVLSSRLQSPVYVSSVQLRRVQIQPVSCHCGLRELGISNTLPKYCLQRLVPVSVLCHTPPAPKNKACESKTREEKRWKGCR